MSAGRDRYLATLRRTACWRGRLWGPLSLDDAEDCFQEAMLILMAGALSKYDPGRGPFDGFLYGVLMMVRLSFSASGDPQRVVLHLGDPEVRELSSEADSLAELEWSDLWNWAVELTRGSLQGLEREVALRTIDGISVSEQARLLERPEGTIRSAICRARRKIWGIVADQFDLSRWEANAWSTRLKRGKRIAD